MNHLSHETSLIFGFCVNRKTKDWHFIWIILHMKQVLFLVSVWIGKWERQWLSSIATWLSLIEIFGFDYRRLNYLFKAVIKVKVYILLTPLNHTFFYSKTGVYKSIHYLFISAQKHRLWYSLEPPRWGGSNEHLHSMFWAEMWKLSELLSENFYFLVVKFSIYLNRRVFVWLLRTRLTCFSRLMHFANRSEQCSSAALCDI